MTTKRLAILLVVLLGGLGSVFLLPKQIGYMPVGVILVGEKTPVLPHAFGEWWGESMEITQKEHDVLVGASFAREHYSNGRGDSVIASIVLSGEDMMTSIHRPERCLRAQGWDFSPGTATKIEVPGKGVIPVMRLKNHRQERLPNGTIQVVENICYYWFAGSSDITASHLDRVWIDMRDRLNSGYAQRWAMMMIATNVTGRQKFGRDEKATDEFLRGFIAKLAPQIHRDTLRYH
jgi:EpsI family protein